MFASDGLGIMLTIPTANGGPTMDRKPINPHTRSLATAMYGKSSAAALGTITGPSLASKLAELGAVPSSKSLGLAGTVKPSALDAVMKPLPLFKVMQPSAFQQAVGVGKSLGRAGAVKPSALDAIMQPNALQRATGVGKSLGRAGTVKASAFDAIMRPSSLDTYGPTLEKIVADNATRERQNTAWKEALDNVSDALDVPLPVFQPSRQIDTLIKLQQEAQEAEQQSIEQMSALVAVTRSMADDLKADAAARKRAERSRTFWQWFGPLLGAVFAIVFTVAAHLAGLV
jgi:hypothetical protein